MNKWDMLHACASTLDNKGLDAILPGCVVPPTILRNTYHSVWKSLRCGADPKHALEFLSHLSMYGSNPLLLQETLEPFVGNWQNPKPWMEHLNMLSHRYMWRTWTQGGLLHSVCVNGAFHLKSIEHLLKIAPVSLHKDIQGNTPWHVLWKEGQLEHLGYLCIHQNYTRLNRIHQLFEQYNLDPHECNMYGESVHSLIQIRLEQMLRFHPTTHDLVHKMWDRYIRNPLAREVEHKGVEDQGRKI